MPAGCAREARYLAAHGHRIEADLQRISNGAAQRANFPHTRRHAWVCALKHEKRRAFAQDSPRKYSTETRPHQSTLGHNQKPPAKHQRTYKPLIYKDFSLRNFSSICCKHGVEPLCEAWNRGCPQSYPQILWVSGTAGGTHSNVTRDLLSIIQAAGWPIWPLIACSVLALSIIIERFVNLRTARVAPPDLFNSIIIRARAKALTDEEIAAWETGSVLGMVLSSPLRYLKAHPRCSDEELKEALQNAGQEAAMRLDQYLSALGTIASVAPLL
eukprot:gene51631-69091_t